MVAAGLQNALLQSLLPADFERLRLHLELIELRLGDVLYEMEGAVDYVYFPEFGLLSLITVMVSGDALETSIVGREGGVGFIEALGSGTMFTRVIVQVPGRAFQVLGRHYADAFDSSASMRRAVHRQTELLQAQSRQAIGCHSLHTVEKRFNRWILECQDLSGGLSVLPLRHEFLAVMLGVSRSTVTNVAGAAQKLGLIRYVRGALEILDRSGLERLGGGTSMRCDPTPASATSSPQTTLASSPERPAGALRTLTTSRAGLLPADKTKGQINPGLSLWLDEKWGSGHCCCCCCCSSILRGDWVMRAEEPSIAPT